MLLLVYPLLHSPWTVRWQLMPETICNSAKHTGQHRAPLRPDDSCAHTCTPPLCTCAGAGAVHHCHQVRHCDTGRRNALRRQPGTRPGGEEGGGALHCIDAAGMQGDRLLEQMTHAVCGFSNR